MGTKFTKGEWEVYTTEIYPEIGIEGRGLASTHENPYVNDDGIDEDEAIANAHLIAAAPDMYELLCRLKSINAPQEYILDDEFDAICSINDVLDKARGEHVQRT